MHILLYLRNEKKPGVARSCILLYLFRYYRVFEKKYPHDYFSLGALCSLCGTVNENLNVMYKYNFDQQLHVKKRCWWGHRDILVVAATFHGATSWRTLKCANNMCQNTLRRFKRIQKPPLSMTTWKSWNWIASLILRLSFNGGMWIICVCWVHEEGMVLYLRIRSSCASLEFNFTLLSIIIIGLVFPFYQWTRVCMPDWIQFHRTFWCLQNGGSRLCWPGDEKGSRRTTS